LFAYSEELATGKKETKKDEKKDVHADQDGLLNEKDEDIAIASYASVIASGQDTSQK
jgi:hypothetical protein